MNVNIKNERVERLLDEVAALTGETRTEAIRRSVPRRCSRPLSASRRVSTTTRAGCSRDFSRKVGSRCCMSRNRTSVSRWTPGCATARGATRRHSTSATACRMRWRLWLASRCSVLMTIFRRPTACSHERRHIGRCRSLVGRADDGDRERHVPPAVCDVGVLSVDSRFPDGTRHPGAFRVPPTKRSMTDATAGINAIRPMPVSHNSLRPMADPTIRRVWLGQVPSVFPRL